MEDKVKAWKSRFPWLSYKNEMRANYAWCKLCDVAVFLPNSKMCMKHQRIPRHIELNNGGRSPGPTEEIAAAAATATASVSGKVRQKVALAKLQSKYNWLDTDPGNENRGQCAVCHTRLPIKAFYLRKHSASRKHAAGLERQRKNAKEAASSVSTNSEATTDGEVQKSGLGKDSDGDMSVRSDGGTAEPPAKQSRQTMLVPRIHEERRQLDIAKDMINSSFDIVTRLRTIEREGAMGYVMEPDLAKVTPTSAEPSKPHLMDLFFESVASTMKSLPADLAAEGKAKIMQLVCGLEVRAMHMNTVLDSESD